MSEQTTNATEAATQAQNDLEGGNYEIIRRRLVDHAQELSHKADQLNERRKETFGSSRMEVVGQQRIRTANKCIPRDILTVDGELLFAYNVFVGVKEAEVKDVFGLYNLQENDGEFEFQEKPLPHYLQHERFQKLFADLYQYNRYARLLHLKLLDNKLLAVFQTGSSVKDIRVMRWERDLNSGQLAFMDDRGDKDYVFPPSHNFKWKETVYDQYVHGEHPHISIENRVFVECVGGDLTIKIEDNTESGEGIYAEPVEDHYQSLHEASIYYAILDSLFLFKIRPKGEDTWRYLVYNELTHSVERIDAIGTACVSLPEGHGLIFPGGYYLTNGETRVFTEDVEGLEFKRAIHSPNGEDVLYIFYQRESGNYTLLPYNLIRKEVLNPIPCHGYSIFEDGKMVIFRFDGNEKALVHPMQIWETPFCSDLYAAQAPTDGSFLSKIGNADLVRGISEFYSIQKSVQNQSPTIQIYEDLIAQTKRAIDTYHWLDKEEVSNVQATLKSILQTADLIIDEFEKVLSLRKQATEALEEVIEHQAKVVSGLRPDFWERVDDFVDALGELRSLRGQLITLREMRYIDLQEIERLEAEAVEHFNTLSAAAVEFLLRDEALEPYHKEVEELTSRIDEVTKVTESVLIQERLDEMSAGLDLLTEIIGNLKIDDATQRTQILEGISEVFALLNRTKALLANRRKELRSQEGIAEFSAQFKLFGQSVANALGLVDTPEKCDDQLSRLMIQLEELESRFSEFDDFLVELATKRDEVYDAFEAKKQTLMEARQRRAANIERAATRILQGIARRAQSFKDDESLNTYFASDAMVLKVRELAQQLRNLGDSVKSDDLEAKIKSSKDQALRSLRDKLDIFEGGDNVIRFGKHRFSVNTQNLELTMLPREEGMFMHLTGTDFYDRIDDEELNKTQPFWEQTLVSETPSVYRGEYLAACILFDAEAARNGLSVHALHEKTRSEGGLLQLVREYTTKRYDEGYDRGIHDVDAVAILDKLLQLRTTGGLLRFPPNARALACLFWGFGKSDLQKEWSRRARSFGRLREAFGHVQGMLDLEKELGKAIQTFNETQNLEHGPLVCMAAGSYLAEELTAERPRFLASAEAVKLREALELYLDSSNLLRGFQEDLRAIEGSLSAQITLLESWLEGFVQRGDEKLRDLSNVIPEAAAQLALDRKIDWETSSAMTSGEVHELLGQHPRIESRNMSLRLDEFIPRLRHFCEEHVPSYRAYRALRQETLERERVRLRLEEYQPRVLTSFVRNQLINDVYLPMIGDNLAKQMGTLGENKRTDLMGMLLLISPPGYGKTTLMEYVANRLGLVFMKINGPALGHSVTSLDPSEAPNVTARQELIKLNLALEMGNNVMLYLDDIQHTHPEFLQKFISLCDGQRRIEGVWKGRTRTYDLRGKKFCVIMAGNPYTETGDKFQIPDMLANRADTYNLGDILNGRDDLFALSYIENTITSNTTLAPLATRDPKDTLKLVRMAQGEEIPANELSHAYSSVELGEIQAVLRHLFKCQDVLLKVNLEYIDSAGKDDDYRTEPAFKLQGSYRNMNKLAEKVVAVMNEEELQALITDHYTGESQTLTTGAEQNLLKLAELRGRMSDAQKDRWEEIKKGYRRIQSTGGKDGDPVTRITNQLGGLALQLEGIQGALEVGDIGAELAQLRESLSLGEIGEKIQGLQQSLNLGEIGAHLSQIQQSMSQNNLQPSLQSIERSIGQAAASVASSPSQDPQLTQIAHYLKRLGEATEALSQARMDVQVVNEQPTELFKLIAQQTEMVEWTLVPLVKTIAQDLQSDREMTQRLEQVLSYLKGATPQRVLPQVARQESHAVYPQGGGAPQQPRASYAQDVNAQPRVAPAARRRTTAPGPAQSGTSKRQTSPGSPATQPASQPRPQRANTAHGRPIQNAQEVRKQAQKTIQKAEATRQKSQKARQAAPQKAPQEPASQAKTSPTARARTEKAPPQTERTGTEPQMPRINLGSEGKGANGGRPTLKLPPVKGPSKE